MSDSAWVRRKGSTEWWVICSDDLIALLRRAHEGEDPDWVYAEAYANSNHERTTDE